MSEPILELRDLRVHYGAIEALRGISLEVQERQVVALIGANGAGKTTTLRAVSRMLRPTSGSVRFQGEEVSRLASHEIVARGLAHAPEGRGIFLNLTVQENLDLGAYLRRDRAGIAQDLSRVFDLFPILADRRSQVSGTLSGGEQQMLAIGRGLLARPRLLLLVEPSIGLAPLVVRAIFECIASLREGGITIMMVEQNARAALGIASRGYVMETGQVVLEGTAAELAANRDVQRAYLGREYSRIEER